MPDSQWLIRLHSYPAKRSLNMTGEAYAQDL